MRFLPVLLFLLALSSCSSPEHKIIGRWKYDHAMIKSTNDPMVTIAKDITDAMCANTWYEFQTGGKLVVQRDLLAGPVVGKYSFENGGKVLVIKTADGTEERWNIQEFSNSQLIYEDESMEDLAIVLKKE